MNLRALLASPLGFAVGLVMGALGGGGAVLAVPSLVYVAGQSPKDATASALLIVMCTALGGLYAHSRDGNVRWSIGIAFGVAGIGGSLIGSALNTLIDGDVLLLAFSGLLLVVSAVMFRQAGRPALDTGSEEAEEATPVLRGNPSTVLKIIAAGSAIGLLTGFFGVGGGFIIVPTLAVILRFPVQKAIGTSLLIISINSLVALVARQAWGSIEWSVALPFTITALFGVAAGNSIARRIPSRVLIRTFAWLLILIAIYTGVQSALAL